MLRYFFTAVLLTPINSPASVKFVKSNSLLVFKSLTLTGTPLSVVAAAENLARVSFESWIPLRASDIFFLSSSVKILPVAAKDKLFLVSSLTLRSFLKNSNVSSLCLNPKEEPACSKTLYFHRRGRASARPKEVLTNLSNIALLLQDLLLLYNTLEFLN